nr:hypothetical protein [Flavobacterium macacae]
MINPIVAPIVFAMASFISACLFSVKVDWQNSINIPKETESKNTTKKSFFVFSILFLRYKNQRIENMP